MHSPTTYAGIDWASRSHAVCVIDASGALVDHSEAGLRSVVGRPHRVHVEGVAIERPIGPVVFLARVWVDVLWCCSQSEFLMTRPDPEPCSASYSPGGEPRCGHRAAQSG